VLLNRSIFRSLLTRGALLIGVGEIDAKKNSNFLVVNSSASPKLKLNSTKRPLHHFLIVHSSAFPNSES
jgi:hypothetical protein